ncbi:Prolyl endopeptidase, partial [uncultured Leptolyngbya sp.]
EIELALHPPCHGDASRTWSRQAHRQDYRGNGRYVGFCRALDGDEGEV